MAGLLGELGCTLPNDLMAPAEMNAKGFFESNRITTLNESILASVGMTWFDLRRFPDSWYEGPKAEAFRQRAAACLEEEFGGSPLFVMKDPRHCRLVRLWDSALGDCGVRPAYVCIFRDPAEVGASLMRWAGYEPLYGQMLWLRHVLDSEAATRGSKRVFLSYEQLLSDWQVVANRIAAELDVTFPRSVQTASCSVAQFLQRDLQHLSSDELAIPRLDDISDWFAATFAVLSRWSDGGEDPSDHATLDRIRSALDASSTTMVPVLNELLGWYRTGNERENATLRLQRDLGEATTALEDAKTRLIHTQHVLHETWLQNRGLQNEVDRQAEEISWLRRRPIKNLKKYLEYKGLRLLASHGAPLPLAMKSRFTRSANKRDPDRGRRRSDTDVATTVRQTASVPQIQGQASFRPDLPSAIIVTHEASRTGAPILAHNLAKSLSSRYNIVTICLNGGELIDDFRKVSIQVHVGGNAAAFPSMVDGVIATANPVFAVVNSIESRHLLGALRERQMPTVALFHEFASYTLPKSAFADAFKVVDEIVFSTELTIQNALEQTSFERMPRFHVIPQGRCEVPQSDTDALQRESERNRLTTLLRPEGEQAGNFLVIGAGSVQLRKGVDLFIDVARRVLASEAGKNARFAWIGAGYDPERDASYSVYIKDQIARAGLTDRLLMVGETAEIEHVYALADALLLTSRLDPLPNVAIDAMSESLPVICFDRTTGIADLLTKEGLRDACVAD